MGGSAETQGRLRLGRLRRQLRRLHRHRRGSADPMGDSTPPWTPPSGIRIRSEAGCTTMMLERRLGPVKLALPMLVTDGGGSVLLVGAIPTTAFLAPNGYVEHRPPARTEPEPYQQDPLHAQPASPDRPPDPSQPVSAEQLPIGVPGHSPVTAARPLRQVPCSAAPTRGRSGIDSGAG